MWSKAPRAAWASLAVMLLIGCWAYVGHLADLPVAADAEKWLYRTRPRGGEGLEYVFTERHFIGYRPTAALSFWLTHAVAGWSFSAHRMVDLALHLFGVTGSWLLARTLFPKHPWLALLAPATVLFHPAAETVVPHLARRSYGLAWVLCCWGGVFWVRGTQQRRQTVALSGVALTWLGAMANETGFATMVALGLLALVVSTKENRRVATSAAALAGSLGLVGLGLRTAVLGRLGGYHKWHMAWFNGERIQLREATQPEPLEVFRSSFDYLFMPFDPDGAGPLLDAPGWIVVALPLVAWAAVRLRGHAGRIALVSVCWMLGLGVLYAASGTFFWRMGQPMLLPLGLLLVSFAVSLRTDPAVQRWQRWSAWLSLAAVLTVLFRHGPADGLSNETTRGRTVATDVWNDLLEHTNTLPNDANLWLALPLSNRLSSCVHRWHLRLTRQPSLLLAERRLPGSRGQSPVQSVSTEGVRLVDTYTAVGPAKPLFRDQYASLAALHRDAPTYLIWTDDSRMHLQEIPAASQPVSRPPRTPEPPGGARVPVPR